MMRSVLALLLVLTVTVLTEEEYKYDEQESVLYSYDHEGVKIEVLKKGENLHLNQNSLKMGQKAIIFYLLN